MIPHTRLDSVDSDTPTELLYPDSLFDCKKLTEDYEYGALALQDPAGGLQQAVWMVATDGSAITLQLLPDGPVETLVTADGDVTEVSLAFDDEMYPYLAWVEDGVVHLLWKGNLLVLDEAYSPRLTLDDKRPGQELLSDVLFFYLRNVPGDDECEGVPPALLYRQQREQFSVERVLARISPRATGLGAVGMNTEHRLQINLCGCGCQGGPCSCADLASPQAPFIFTVDHTGEDYDRSSGWVVFFIREGTSEHYNFCVEWGDGCVESFTEAPELQAYYNADTDIWHINGPVCDEEIGEEIGTERWLIGHEYQEPGIYTIKVCGECGAPHFGFDLTGGENSPLFATYVPRFAGDDYEWVHFPLPHLTILQWGVLIGANNWAGAFGNRSVEALATDGLGKWLYWSPDEDDYVMAERAYIAAIFYHDVNNLSDPICKVDVTNWTVGSEESWWGAFYGAEITGGSFVHWDASRVYYMDQMFAYSNLDQDLSCWDVEHNPYHTGFAYECPIDGTAKMPKWGLPPNTGCV